MKKFVAGLIIFLCFIFCSCTTDTSGYTYELTSSKWTASLKGGAKVELSFDCDIAEFKLKSGDFVSSIKGKYVADDKSFVIFVPEIARNYTFDYTPQGNKLELKFNDNAITMQKVNCD